MRPYLVYDARYPDWRGQPPVNVLLSDAALESVVHPYALFKKPVKRV
jgi:hypothetical protein